MRAGVSDFFFYKESNFFIGGGGVEEGARVSDFFY